MILILPDKEMKQEFVSATFQMKGIRPVFWTLTIFLFPSSILAAQAISLFFGYSLSQFSIVEHLSFTAN
jgi:hypothetical protein